jgi:DNA-binding CsgD family transcriptional regulator
MDLAGIREAVGALRRARDEVNFVLLDPGAIEGLLRVFQADEISFNDLDLDARRSATTELLTTPPDEHFSEFWEHFWDTPSCCYTEQVSRLRGEVMMTDDFYSTRQWHSTGMYTDCLGDCSVEKALVMPLPAPLGIARRLCFFRHSDRSFAEEHRSAATLLQPHIADALRRQGRHAAIHSLTPRQRDLLLLVAAGHTNTAIARQLGLSPFTVRTHLENAFARLGVSSRTQAIAKVYPDATWH